MLNLKLIIYLNKVLKHKNLECFQMFKNKNNVLVTFGLLITGKKKHFDSISSSAVMKTKKETNFSLIQQK